MNSAASMVGHHAVDEAHSIATAAGHVLVAIPAFDEDRFIGSLVLKLRARGHAVVVVDDGSSDSTGDVGRGGRRARHPPPAQSGQVSRCKDCAHTLLAQPAHMTRSMSAESGWLSINDDRRGLSGVEAPQVTRRVSAYQP